MPFQVSVPSSAAWATFAKPAPAMDATMAAQSIDFFTFDSPLTGLIAGLTRKVGFLIFCFMFVPWGRWRKQARRRHSNDSDRRKKLPANDRNQILQIDDCPNVRAST